MEKISVFGLGYVGCVSLGCLARNGHSVVGVDIVSAKVDSIRRGNATIIEEGIDSLIRDGVDNGRITATESVEEAIEFSDISIICVGTPSTAEGDLDLSAVYRTVESIAVQLKRKAEKHYIVVRSTIVPGASKEIIEILEKGSAKRHSFGFEVVLNPEFLREGTAIHDYYNPPYTLIGSENYDSSQRIAAIYSGINSEVVITNLLTAEIIKLINNAFHALKVSFANEIGNICTELGIDSIETMEIFARDKILNISSYYLKPGFAYGGSCLPKDLKALNAMAQKNDLLLPILGNIEKSNSSQLSRAANIIDEIGKRNLFFIGLAFKEGTDDLRNSPFLKLLELFRERRFSVKVFDRKLSMALGSPNKMKYLSKETIRLKALMVDDFWRHLNDETLVIYAVRDEDLVDLICADYPQSYILDFVGEQRLANLKNYRGINW